MAASQTMVSSLPFVFKDILGEYHFDNTGKFCGFFPVCTRGQYTQEYAYEVEKHLKGLEKALGKVIPFAQNEANLIMPRIVANGHRHLKELALSGRTSLRAPPTTDFTPESFYEFGQTYNWLILTEMLEWTQIQPYSCFIELKPSFPYISLMLENPDKTSQVKPSWRLDGSQVATEDQIALDPSYLIQQTGSLEYHHKLQFPDPYPENSLQLLPAQRTYSPNTRHGSSTFQFPIERFSSLLTGFPVPDGFAPSNMLIANRSAARAARKAPPQNHGNRYQGSMHSSSFLETIEGLDDNLNCALFVTNISSTVTIAQFFAIIKTGAVRIFVMKAPTSGHLSQAAKLVFTTAIGAQAFFKQAEIGIFLHRKHLTVKYNKFGHLDFKKDQSRVIIIEGPSDSMTVGFWTRWFNEQCIFQHEHVAEVQSANGAKKQIEFRFVRIDGQAETCLLAFSKTRAFKGVFKAWYGDDPCDPDARG